MKGLRWTVKNGESVNMWMDFWLPNERLRELIEGPLTHGEAELSVKQCFDENHVSNPSSISFELPESVLNSIMATPFFYDPHSIDELMWAFSKNEYISLKSADLLARGLNPLNLDTMSFKWVSKIETPPKVQFFMWLFLHDRLPTVEVLGSTGLILDPMCKMCNRGYETIEHLFKGCEVAYNFWQQLQIPHYTRNSFTLPFKEWTEANCKDAMNATMKGIYWKILFPIGLWQLWLNKNNFVFRTGTVDD